MRLAYSSAQERRQIMSAAQPFGPRIRKITDRTITIEIAESPELVDDFVEVMSRFNIFDMSRSGMTALGPGLPPERRDGAEPKAV